jgi:hypothetical protein
MIPIPVPSSNAILDRDLGMLKTVSVVEKRKILEL